MNKDKVYIGKPCPRHVGPCFRYWASRRCTRATKEDSRKAEKEERLRLKWKSIIQYIPSP